jgi:ABC-type lipoprotein release transport system permease subunit
LFRANLRFHARSHLGTLLGVTVASAILVGALALGDCVRESLRALALARIGRASFALASRDRFFRSALADALRPGASNGLAAAVLQLPGTATTPDDSARANRVQILGVDEHFWALAQRPPPFGEIPADSVVLNAALARQLRVKIGDAVVLRIQKPSLLSLEAPISPREDVSAGLRLTVSGIAGDAELGRFGLQAGPAPPLNAFVRLSFLQEKVDLPGRANLLLTAGPAPDLKQHWTLADADLELREVPGGLELRTGRVFLDPAVTRAAAGWMPELVLTYFVNELRDGERTTPYSMVTAASAPLVPAEMPDYEIILNQWLADDLQAKAGDDVRLTYFVAGVAHRLEEKQDHFRVRAVVPMEGPTADRTLMPDFPGIAKAEKTENWDAGFAIDMQKIRPKDEQYWKQYRGTPKAFVTLAAGRRMWGNRFGDLTGIRFASGSREAIKRALLAKLDPASIGLMFAPVREQALAGSSQSEDFGGLFLGFSFFLIAAALILLALLFHFGLEKRATEVGILLALGWPPAQVRRLLLLEGAAIALAGGLLGVAGGVLYARATLYGLVTMWRAAVAESPLQFHVTAQTLILGGAAGFLISMLVIWFALRAQVKRPARELLEQGAELEREIPTEIPRRRWAGWIALGSGLGALAMIASALAKRDHADVEAFFFGGALFLISGIAGAALWLRKLAARVAARPLTLTSLGVRGCSRQPRRSVAIVALLASASFLIVAVEANKLDATRDSGQRSSGTGGFAFVGESSLPIVQDLDTTAGREFFGLDEKSLRGVSVMPLRVRDGDDASCLNLNRAQTPRLLGVKPEQLQSRNAFTFTALADPSDAAQPWLMLEKSGNEIPAIADQATITWALHKKIGDTVTYTDEHGQPVRVRLAGAVANSILQGSLLISETAFTRHFPGETGYRMFLIDAPPKEEAAVAAALSRALRDRGLELTAAAERLNAFNAVQNTYLTIFQVVGGLGLLLGSAGLGVVVLRNVLERRGELALLAAVGFRPRALRWLVVSEHAALECLGLALGLGAAFLAVLPALLSPGAQISCASLAATLGLVFLSGVFWTWAAARLALRGELLPALRNE